MNSMQQEGIVDRVMNGGFGFIRTRGAGDDVFFHISNVAGDPVRSGDEVCFEMHAHKGRIQARRVRRMPPGTIVMETVCNDVSTGFVVEFVRGGFGSLSLSESGGNSNGIPFRQSDLKDQTCMLVRGDTVSFQVMTDFFGVQHAVNITLQSSCQRGVVKLFKDRFGFIDREDVPELLYFHASDWVPDRYPCVGDCVSFRVVRRPDTSWKIVAANVDLLPPHSVVLETVAEGREHGTIATLPVTPFRNPAAAIRSPDPGTINRPEMGEILLDAADLSSSSVPLAVLRVGDSVTFQVAEDLRTRRQRAINVILERANFEGQARVYGTIAIFKAQDGFGFATILEAGKTKGKIYFHVSEIVSLDWCPRVGDGVEFEIVTKKEKQWAARVLHVATKAITSAECVGVVVRVSASSSEEGEIEFKEGQILCYRSRDVADPRLRLCLGDRVTFTLRSSTHATRIALQRVTGCISQIHEGFGFIETASMDGEIYFNFQSVMRESASLRAGDPVTYAVSNEPYRGKSSSRAVDIRRVSVNAAESASSSDIALDIAVLDECVLRGRVSKALRGPGEYAGRIRFSHQSEVCELPFGICSLADPQALPSLGDRVEFRLAAADGSLARSVVKVTVVRDVVLSARIIQLNADHGILDYSPPQTSEPSVKFLFSSVVGGIGQLFVGGDTTFSLCYNVSTDSYTAENVTYVRRNTTTTPVPRPQPYRQPRGPDGTRGFARPEPVTA